MRCLRGIGFAIHCLPHACGLFKGSLELRRFIFALAEATVVVKDFPKRSQPLTVDGSE
jgi:hypothetical protein